MRIEYFLVRLKGCVNDCKKLALSYFGMIYTYRKGCYTYLGSLCRKISKGLWRGVHPSYRGTHGMIPFYKTVGFARYGQAGVEKSDHYVKKETHEETHYKSVSCAGVLSDPAATLDGERIETSIGNDTEGDGDIDNNVEE